MTLRYNTRQVPSVINVCFINGLNAGWGGGGVRAFNPLFSLVSLKIPTDLPFEDPEHPLEEFLDVPRRGSRGGGGGGRAPPPALDHQFFFSTNFLTIAKKKY